MRLEITGVGRGTGGRRVLLDKVSFAEALHNIPADCELRNINEWKPQKRPRLFGATELLNKCIHPCVVMLVTC